MTIQHEYAYFVPEAGPEDRSGVALHWIVPNERVLAAFLPIAEKEGDGKRAARLKEMYGTPGFSTPLLGWWWSEEDYYAGKSGTHGTRADIEAKYPNLTIVGSKEEAAKAAKATGY